MGKSTQTNNGVNFRLTRKLLNSMPTTWLDPLLTGKDAVINKPPYDCQDIERLLLAIKGRMEMIINKHIK